MTEHGDSVRAWLIVICSEPLTGYRLNAEQRKEIRCHTEHFNLLRFAIAGEIEAAPVHGCHVFKNLILIFDVDVVRRRGGVFRKAGEQASSQTMTRRIRVGERKRPQEDSVNHTEDGRVGANTQRQRNDCNRRKARAV